MMQVAVWDTYVKRDDGKVMHFDILVESKLTDTSAIFNYGKEYLADKKFGTGPLTMNECQFCHIEQASPELQKRILEKGYCIIEIKNCD
ncbi:MAG: DUF2024 family protein [Fulvivirga sp.]